MLILGTEEKMCSERKALCSAHCWTLDSLDKQQIQLSKIQIQMPDKFWGFQGFYMDEK